MLPCGERLSCTLSADSLHEQLRGEHEFLAACIRHLHELKQRHARAEAEQGDPESARLRAANRALMLEAGRLLMSFL